MGTLVDRIVAALEACQPLDQDIAAVIVAGIKSGSVDRALGLSPASRDDLIRDGVARFLGKEAAPAERLEERLSLYAGTAWARGERNLDECPKRHLGKLEEYLWHVLKLRDRTLCARQIRRILDISMSARIVDDHSMERPGRI
jgi:hypothetical protein